MTNTWRLSRREVTLVKIVCSELLKHYPSYINLSIANTSPPEIQDVQKKQQVRETGGLSLYSDSDDFIYFQGDNLFVAFLQTYNRKPIISAKQNIKSVVQNKGEYNMCKG